MVKKSKNSKNKANTKGKSKAGTKKNKVEIKEKPKSFKKPLMYIIPVIVIICIIAGIFVILSLNPDIISGDVTEAQLIIGSGTVELKHLGESWEPAEDGTLLVQSDSVKTGDDSAASIILFESSIIRLDSNTEVTIKELIQDAEQTSVSLQQDAGRTWNTVAKISGIDNYEVETPTTVASVRGTGFVVIVQSNGSTYYGVDHGLLNVSSITNGTINELIDVSGNESVFIYVNMTNKSLEIKPFERDDWIEANLLLDEQFVTDIKAELYSRIEPHIPELKERYGMTDEELDVLLDGYINGLIDLPEDTPDWIREIIELA